MPEKNFKSNITKMLIAFACAGCLGALAKLISKNKGKKQLNSEIVQKELIEYVEANKESIENFEPEKFQDGFLQYLKDKNYDCEGMKKLANMGDLKEDDKKSAGVKNLPAKIQKISEDLNDCLNGTEIFTRVFDVTAGLVCYTIEKIAPTNKKPFVTYRPSPRVITQVHETGVNRGTVFLTCAHKFVKSVDFKGEESAKVISEEEAIFTPLSKEHALYVCKVLNAQSKIFYMQHMKKYQKTK